MTQMTCSTCGTVYTLPASGPPFCPNNNCPRHSTLTPGASSLRAAAADALREADAWDAAVEQAEEALRQAKANARAARERIAETLAKAEEAAEEDLASIRKMRG